MAFLFRAVAYSAETNYIDASKDFIKAFQLAPTNSDVLNGYAWFLATSEVDSSRDGKRAVELATKACEITKWKVWNCIGTLGAAYAEAGDFEKALVYEKQAIATDGISHRSIDEEKQRMELFQQHKPTREMAELWP